MGSHQTLWSLLLPNVTWHSGTWPYTMTPSIDQTLHQFANLLPNWTFLPILTLLPNFGGFHRTLHWVRLTNRGRLLLRTPGPVPFGTCICSNVETILSWTCHVYGPFEFQTSSVHLFSLINCPNSMRRNKEHPSSLNVTVLLLWLTATAIAPFESKGVYYALIGAIMWCISGNPIGRN